MDEGSGKIQEASAHAGSFIVMDVAIVESHVAAMDVTPALQKKEGKGHGKVIQRGDGRRFRESSRRVQDFSAHNLCAQGIKQGMSARIHPTG